MPAMPIALSSAPIVVGISETSSAIRIVIDTAVPANVANGRSVTTTARKTIVRPASRIESAISFGVLRRSAPSTSVIMRSMNDCPGSCVISTTMRSESTRVPPVTALRSPPDSRMTGCRLAGDRGLVDRRDALDDGAVAGDHLAGLDHDHVALDELGGRLASCRRAAWRRVSRAHRAQRVGLRLAAALGDRLGEVARTRR